MSGGTLNLFASPPPFWWREKKPSLDSSGVVNGLPLPPSPSPPPQLTDKNLIFTPSHSPSFSFPVFTFQKPFFPRRNTTREIWSKKGFSAVPCFCFPFALHSSSPQPRKKLFRPLKPGGERGWERERERGKEIFVLANFFANDFPFPCLTKSSFNEKFRTELVFFWRSFPLLLLLGKR